MRLWSVDLLGYLPKSQLLSQKRECDLIWKDIKAGKKTNHILINYIWNYDLSYFQSYYNDLQGEFDRRGFKFKDNSVDIELNKRLCYEEHNFEYLEICFYNLKEKYLRGQTDFTQTQFVVLQWFYEMQKYKNTNRARG